MPRISQLAAFLATDPTRARAAILDALEQAQGRRAGAARVLCVDERTLYRYLSRMRMWDEVDALARARGWEIRAPGRGRV